MSYCRWSEESSVYVYGSSDGEGGPHYITCCGCHYGSKVGMENFTTYGDLLRHLARHEADGDRVPAYAYERIHAEIANPEDRWIEVGDLPDVDG